MPVIMPTPYRVSIVAPTLEWTQQAKILPSVSTTSEGFGVDVSISGDGNTIIVGADSSAYIFTRFNGTWSTPTKLVASNASVDDSFGWTVELSDNGETAFVGAPNYTTNHPAGAVYVFTRIDNTWTEATIITPADGGTWDSFGTSISISGNNGTLAVGSDEADTSYTDGGAVYIYTGADATWTQEAKIIADANYQYYSNRLGTSVALSYDGNTLGTVQFGNDRNTFVYTRVSTVWSLQAVLNTDGDNAIEISNDGNTILSTKADVKEYTRTGDTWSLSGTVITRGNFFNGGFNIALTADGSRTAMRAGVDGEVYVLNKNTGTWLEETKLFGNDTISTDNFGKRVAMSDTGNTIVVGAQTADPGGIDNAGSAYVFNYA